MRHIRKMSQGNLRLHTVEGVTHQMEKNWVWRQGKKYPIKMSKHAKHKERDFDWERLACAITSHIGKLQNCKNFYFKENWNILVLNFG